MKNEKPTILYVDDEPINLLLFKTLFSEKYFVLTADSGAEGLIIVDKKPDIDVIISDMKMPGMNGIEFIMKAKEYFPRIIFFILTGYDITEEIFKAIQNNLIRMCFQKPFKMIEIDTAIQKELSEL